MNDTLDILLNRRTFRGYEDKDIKQEDVEVIKTATVRAPTAGNMALYSVLEIKDQSIKDKLALTCDNQPFIAKAPMVWVFLADFSKWDSFIKQSGKDYKAGNGLLHLCLQDALIAAQTSVIAAEALDIGSCYIGDIIEEFDTVVPLLNLPKYVIPAAMITFGYKKNKERKTTIPRCNNDALFMENTYKEKDLERLKKDYEPQTQRALRVKAITEDETLANYYYNRKFNTKFMNEMNASVQKYFDRWINS